MATKARARALSRLRGRRLYLTVEGPGTSPDDVDPLIFVRLAGSYFELLIREAKAKNETLRLRGFRVEEGSAAGLTTVSNVSVAGRAARAADRHISGQDAPTASLEHWVKAVRKQVESLPTAQSARVVLGRFRKTLAIAAEPERTVSARTTLRVVVQRVGGMEPRAELTSISEPTLFTAAVESREVAQRLALQLYKPVDAELEIVRDVAGTIDSKATKLINFDPMESGDATALWTAWYREFASAWDEVEDIEAELAADRS